MNFIWRRTMSKNNMRLGLDWFSALLGAIGGGILVILLTKAIPTMMANMMSAMMGKMMSRMSASGCNPQEM